MSDQNKELFQIISRALLRCWVIGFLLLGIGFAATQFARGFITDIHGSMFDLSAHEIDLILYCGLGLIKLCVVIFFLVPWLSLKLVLAKPTQ